MNNFAFFGVGWRFPVDADTASGHIKMSRYEEDIAEALRIILHTAKGERVMRPDFGSPLRSYIFGDMSLSSLSLMAGEIKNSLVLWEPRIRDIEVQVSAAEEKGRADITVAYSVRTTNNRYNMVFPYYLDER